MHKRDDPTIGEEVIIKLLERDHFEEVRVSSEVSIKIKKIRKPVNDLKRYRRARRTKTKPEQRCILVHCSRPKNTELVGMVQSLNEMMER